MGGLDPHVKRNKGSCQETCVSMSHIPLEDSGALLPPEVCTHAEGKEKDVLSLQGKQGV